MLPAALRQPLTEHPERVRAQHTADLVRGCGSVALPEALRGKYARAPLEWGWQWVFPATRFYIDSATGERRRHHLHESVLQRAVKDAARAAGIPRPATCHTLRHHADNRIMPTTFSCPPSSGGDRAFSHRVIGIIRDVRETRAADPVDDTGLASHQAGWCAPVLAL